MILRDGRSLEVGDDLSLDSDERGDIMFALGDFDPSVTKELL